MGKHNRGKGKRKKKSKLSVRHDENLMLVDKERLNMLQADATGSRWLICALLEQMGGKATIDPAQVLGETAWELHREDTTDGKIVLSLSNHAKKRIMTEPESSSGRKGREENDGQRSTPEVAPS